MIRKILFLTLMLCASKSWAACSIAGSIYTATNAADLASCFSSATHSGDQVHISGAGFALTTQVSWTAPANAVLYGDGSTSIIGGNDVTILTDNDTVNESLLSIGTNASGTFRMYGITFRGGSGVLKDNGAISVGGSGTQTRIDHIHWDATTYSPYNEGKWMQISGGVRGVMDHNIIDTAGISWLHFTNGGDFAGDATWAADTNLGSSDFFFIEDNIISEQIEAFTAYKGTATDCQTGGRYVARFNTFLNMGIGQTHPTGHSGDDRGCRAHEIYGNKLTSSYHSTGKEPNFATEYTNSGVGMFWNNESLDVTKTIVYLNNCRRDTACGYDPNPPPANWGHCGTAFNGTGSNWDRNDVASTGLPCIDEPGRGKGDLVTGLFPTKINSTTGTVHWTNEALEPEYIWMNNATIAPGYGTSYYNDHGYIISDVNYYQQASGIQTNATTPFNGTTGTGWGTLANRPTTCTTSSESGGGPGYFATDQGSWNQSSSNSWGVQMSGADGVLYRCSATNTWTVQYTPYTYPHPLQGFVAETQTPAKLVPMRMILMILIMFGAMAAPVIFGGEHGDDQVDVHRIRGAHPVFISAAKRDAETPQPYTVSMDQGQNKSDDCL